MNKILLLIFVITVTIFGQTAGGGWDSLPISVNASYGDVYSESHSHFGHERCVRFDSTVFRLAQTGGFERLWKSSDNGDTWVEIGSLVGYSGCLLSIPDSSFIWFNLQYDEELTRTIQHYTTTVVAPQSFSAIYTHTNLRGENTVYNLYNATVDSNGIVYCFFHYNATTGRPDSLWCIASLDSGKTFPGYPNATLVYGASSGVDTSLGYQSADVTSNNTLVVGFSDYFSWNMYFAKSVDSGKTFEVSTIANHLLYNPNILPYAGDTIFIFGQADLGNTHGELGLVFNVTYDEGETWAGWEGIDDTFFQGYADPNSLLTSEGHILVAYRSGARPDQAGLTSGTPGRLRVAYSEDQGQSWTFPDNYFYSSRYNPGLGDTLPISDTVPRVAGKQECRYQTWWNYGGVAEWSWMQHTNEVGSSPRYSQIFCDRNDDIQIFNIQDASGFDTPFSIDSVKSTKKDLKFYMGISDSVILICSLFNEQVFIDTVGVDTVTVTGFCFANKIKYRVLDKNSSFSIYDSVYTQGLADSIKTIVRPAKPDSTYFSFRIYADQQDSCEKRYVAPTLSNFSYNAFTYNDNSDTTFLYDISTVPENRFNKYWKQKFYKSEIDSALTDSIFMYIPSADNIYSPTIKVIFR